MINFCILSFLGMQYILHRYSDISLNSSYPLVILRAKYGRPQLENIRPSVILWFFYLESYSTAALQRVKFWTYMTRRINCKYFSFLEDLMSPTFIVLAAGVGVGVVIVLLLISLICSKLCRSGPGYTATRIQVSCEKVLLYLLQARLGLKIFCIISPEILFIWKKKEVDQPGLGNYLIFIFN